MSEVINLLGFVVTIIITVGATLYGVYKVATSIEQRANTKIDNVKEELINFKLKNNEKYNCMELNTQNKINKIEKKISSIENLADDIKSIKDNICDLYDKLNELTEKVNTILNR